MDTYLSSPDPLNDSPTYHSAVKPRVSSKARHSFPLDGSSPTKQTFELDIGNRLSPKKIRVTVEAESSDADNAYDHRQASPSPLRQRASKPINRRVKTTTTTVSVPLKGLSDSEGEATPVATPKRPRGRPRKSGTPIPVAKRGRNTTPTQKKRRSIGTLFIDGEDPEDADFTLGRGVSVGRGRAASKTKSVKANSRKSSTAAEEAQALLPTMSSTRDSPVSNGNAPEVNTVHQDERGGSYSDTLTDDLVEQTEGLSVVDENTPRSTSAYSTMRSGFRIEDAEPDVTLARFSPGNETPPRPGWSSPRTFNAESQSSPLMEAEYSRSRSESSQHFSEDQDDIDSVMSSPMSPANDEIESGEHEDEYQDFDTIMESEGFSMISVDSVLSLREHLSSPPNQESMQEPVVSIKNKSLLAVQALETAKDDSFSSIPDEVLEAATPGRNPHKAGLLSVPISRVDDSFSSIPGEVLEAATPGGHNRATNRSTGSSSRIADSSHNMHPDSSIMSVSRAPLSQTWKEDVNEHSSSVNPSRTPELTSAPSFKRISSQDSTSVSKIQPAISAGLNVLTSGNKISLNVSRLMTPEESPSPSDHSFESRAKQPDLRDDLPNRDELKIDVPDNDLSRISQMRSSPPVVAPRRYTYSAHLRQRRSLCPGETQTPSIVFSSPTLPPLIQAANGQNLQQKQLVDNQQEKISPTLRAGRLLQGIVVPTSSPRSRAHSLGSPFKSPSTDRRYSPSAALDVITSPTRERFLQSLPTQTLGGKVNTKSSDHAEWDKLSSHDDPFSNNTEVQKLYPPTAQTQAYTLELPQSQRLSDLRLPNPHSEDALYPSQDEMSWQAEEEVRMSDATSSIKDDANFSTGSQRPLAGAEGVNQSNRNVQTTIEQKWSAERAAVSRKIELANKKDVISISSDEDASDEEDDILLETINSSSPAVRESRPNTEPAERPRRSKIPSPWRKNSKRLVYSDELLQLSSAPQVKKLPVVSQLVQADNDDSRDADLSEFLIPQKANFKPVVQERSNLDLSALLGSSPTRTVLPVLPRSSRDDNHFVSAPAADIRTARRSEEQLGPISQKLNFKPQVIERNGLKPSGKVSPQCSLPESSARNGSVQPLGLSSPSKNNTPPQNTYLKGQSPSSVSDDRPGIPAITQASVQRHQEQTFSPEDSYASYTDESLLSQDESDSHLVERRTLQWTETVHLTTAKPLVNGSPTKSCLRSPVKTTGFGKDSGPELSPSKNVAFVSSSPTPSSPIERPLSSTTWTDDHFRLLRSILESWNPENRGKEVRRRHSTRVISKYLGKRISMPNGDAMVMQQWHLDAVDEFRSRVDGWDEEFVARGVFGLVMNAPRRAARKAAQAKAAREAAQARKGGVL